MPLSATHHGDAALDVSPHALTRFESTACAAPGTSETRAVTSYAALSPLGVLDTAAFRALAEVEPNAKSSRPTTASSEIVRLRMEPPSPVVTTTT